MYVVLSLYLIKDDFIALYVFFLFCNNYFVNECAGIFSFDPYLEPMSLLVRSYYFELIKTHEHSNADFKSVNYIRLTGITVVRSVLRTG